MPGSKTTSGRTDLEYSSENRNGTNQYADTPITKEAKKTNAEFNLESIGVFSLCSSEPLAEGNKIVEVA